MGCLFLTIHSFWTNGREIRVSYAKRKFQAFLRIGREPLKKRKTRFLFKFRYVSSQFGLVFYTIKRFLSSNEAETFFRLAQKTFFISSSRSEVIRIPTLKTVENGKLNSAKRLVFFYLVGT